MINLRAATAFAALLRLAAPAVLRPALTLTPAYGFAFMQLFERNKKPHELSPIFKRETKLKGHLKSKATKFYSKKLNTNVRRQKQKLKNHKGLLKRIKIVSTLPRRSAPGGIACSSSSPQAPDIFAATRVAPTLSRNAAPDMSMSQTCPRSENWSPTSSGSRSSRDTDPPAISLTHPLSCLTPAVIPPCVNLMAIMAIRRSWPRWT